VPGRVVRGAPARRRIARAHHPGNRVPGRAARGRAGRRSAARGIRRGRGSHRAARARGKAARPHRPEKIGGSVGRRECARDPFHAARRRERGGCASLRAARRAVRNGAHAPRCRAHRSRERDLRGPGRVKRLWALLVALCAAGLLLASPFLLATVRGVQSSMSPLALLAVQALQTLLLCALAAYAGVRFAPAAGLDAPWLRVLAEGRSPPPAFGSMAIEAAAVGSITAVVVTALGLMLRASLPDALWRPASGGFWMRASSAFYGGIVEEILVRWGLLTAFVVVARRAGVSAPFWPANVIAALVFGALHFPSLALAQIPLTGAVIAHVLLANGIAGVVFGWMFRRRGLEGAMVAHGSADVWLQAALPALLA